MSLLDGIRAALPAVAAARTGYLAGQHQGEEENKRDQRENAALARQSRLDAIRAQMEQSQSDEARARTRYYDTRAANPTGSTTAPRTLSTDEGIMQWDPVQKKFMPTGFQPPEKAADRAAARTAAKERHQGTKDALTGVDQQISTTRQEMRDVPNDPSLADDNAMTSRLGQIRSRLDSLTRVGDSLNAELKQPGSGARAMRGTPGTGDAPLTPAAKGPSAADQDYARAAAAYKAALAEATTPADRDEAQRLYNKAVARLARVHGQIK